MLVSNCFSSVFCLPAFFFDCVSYLGRRDLAWRDGGPGTGDGGRGTGDGGWGMGDGGGGRGGGVEMFVTFRSRLSRLTKYNH